MWPFDIGKKKRAHVAECWRVAADTQARCLRESAKWDADWEEYCALPDRPRRSFQARRIEGAPLEWFNGIDPEDWKKWKAERDAEIATIPHGAKP